MIIIYSTIYFSVYITKIDENEVSELKILELINICNLQ